MLDLLLPLLVRFSLVVARLGGLLATSPLLGSRLFPPRVRVATAVVLGLVFTVAPGIEAGPIPLHPGVLVALVARELLVGASLGLLVRLVTGAVTMAGTMLGIQMGLGMAQVMDPQSSVQLPMVGLVMGMAAVAALFAVDAHHLLIAALYRSFSLVPVGRFSFGTPALRILFTASGDLFLIAVGLAAPVILAVFLTNVGMAFLARTVPQMNVFAVGFALTISVGLIVVGVSLPGIIGTFAGFRDRLGGQLLLLVRGL